RGQAGAGADFCSEFAVRDTRPALTPIEQMWEPDRRLAQAILEPAGFGLVSCGSAHDHDQAFVTGRTGRVRSGLGRALISARIVGGAHLDGVGARDGLPVVGPL